MKAETCFACEPLCRNACHLSLRMAETVSVCNQMVGNPGTNHALQVLMPPFFAQFLTLVKHRYQAEMALIWRVAWIPIPGLLVHLSCQELALISKAAEPAIVPYDLDTLVALSDSLGHLIEDVIFPANGRATWFDTVILYPAFHRGQDKMEVRWASGPFILYSWTTDCRWGGRQAGAMAKTWVAWSAQISWA